jgi:hypothetical protein
MMAISLADVGLPTYVYTGDVGSNEEYILNLVTFKDNGVSC